MQHHTPSTHPSPLWASPEGSVCGGGQGPAWASNPKGQGITEKGLWLQGTLGEEGGTRRGQVFPVSAGPLCWAIDVFGEGREKTSGHSPPRPQYSPEGTTLLHARHTLGQFGQATHRMLCPHKKEQGAVPFVWILFPRWPTLPHTALHALPSSRWLPPGTRPATSATTYGAPTVCQTPRSTPRSLGSSLLARAEAVPGRVWTARALTPGGQTILRPGSFYR